jgi:hypothetical protein
VSPVLKNEEAVWAYCKLLAHNGLHDEASDALDEWFECDQVRIITVH